MERTWPHFPRRGSETCLAFQTLDSAQRWGKIRIFRSAMLRRDFRFFVIRLSIIPPIALRIINFRLVSHGQKELNQDQNRKEGRKRGSEYTIYEETR